MQVSIASQATAWPSLRLAFQTCGGLETAGQLLDLRARHAAIATGAEQVVEVQRLDRVVGADPVPGRVGREFRRHPRLVRIKTSRVIGRLDQFIVPLFRDDVECFAHVSGSRIEDGGWWIVPTSRRPRRSLPNNQ